MKKILTLILTVISNLTTFAQYNPDWVIPSPDYFKTGKMIAIDTSNNLIAVGYRPGYAGNANIYTRKFNPAGNLLWEQTDSSGIAWKFEKPEWVNIDNSNNIYVSGYSYSGTSNVYTDTIVVIKYDPSGNLIWKTKIGHPWQSSLPMRSAFDENSNLYIGTVGLSPGFELIKLDSAGNLIFDVSNASALNQSFNSMRLKGSMAVLTSYAANGTQASVVAFDTSGAFLWSKILQSRGGMDVEMDDSLNSYVLTQNFDQVSPTSNSDIQIYKLSSTGVLINQHNYDFGGSYDVATRMTLVNNKISIIGWSIQSGFAYMDWITFQTDLNGNKLWDNRYNFTTSNDEKPSWVSANDNGDVYVSGQGGPDTVGFNGSVYLRFVTVKYHNNGIMQWVDADPYQGYIGVANVIGKDCGLYVLGEYAMTVVHYEDSCVSVPTSNNELNNNFNNVNLFPNPAANLASLEFTNTDKDFTKIIITDLSGREIKTFTFKKLNLGKCNVELDFTELTSGVYLCKTISGGITKTIKFIKL